MFSTQQFNMRNEKDTQVSYSDSTYNAGRQAPIWYGEQKVSKNMTPKFINSNTHSGKDYPAENQIKSAFSYKESRKS